MFWTFYFIAVVIGLWMAFSLGDDGEAEAMILVMVLSFIPLVNVVLAMIILVAFIYDSFN